MKRIIETPCYNATVNINGKKALVSYGHGGSDRQHTYPESDFRLQEINEWVLKI